MLPGKFWNPGGSPDSDASPTIACAACSHGWDKDSLSELAHSLIAGHFLECSTYVTGGNFSGFKSLPGDVSRIGFPVAEIAADGTFVITKQKGRGAMVTVETCKTQLVYEIQGPLYYNSDVVAELSNIKIEQVGENRVYVLDPYSSDSNQADSRTVASQT
jgi:hypothetical protein